MALNFTSDIMTLFASKVGNDANYQSPGNFGLTLSESGIAQIDHVTVTTAGSYTTAPTATPSSGSATFTVKMKLLNTTAVSAAGTVYTPGDVLSLVGGTKTTTATVTVATVKLISATIAAGGTGYGNAQTFTATVVGGTSTVAATVSATSNAGGVVVTINSVSAAGSYTVLPTLSGAATTGGTGTGLTLNLVFGVNTISLTNAGVYTVLPANAVATTGGTGTGATLTTAWGVLSVTVLVNDTYATTPTLNFSGGAAAATIVLTGGASTTAQADEQKLLMTVELLRSLIAEVSNPVQMKDIHTVIRKMLSTMHSGGSVTGAGSSSFSASVATMASNAQSEALHYIALNPKRLVIPN